MVTLDVFKSVAVQCAYKIGLLQVVCGAIYSTLMNRFIDPHKQMCNPPGVLALMTLLRLPNPTRNLRSHAAANSPTSLRDSGSGDGFEGLRESASKRHFNGIHAVAGQSIELDANFFSTCLLLAVTLYYLHIWVHQASDDMGVPFVPLFLGLAGIFTSDEIGRCQRREHLKNAEAIARWTYVYFPMTMIVLVGSGPDALAFMVLVVLVRYVSDAYRTVYRALWSTMAHSSVLRGIVQILWGSVILPVVIGLSFIVSSSSQSGQPPKR